MWATPKLLLVDSCFVSIEETSDFRLEWLRGADTGEDYWDELGNMIVSERSVAH